MTALTVIHVNSHTIKRNRRTGERQPPIAVRRGRSGAPQYVERFEANGVRVVYDPDHPLQCGATVWIEVDS